jgi:4-hydroxybenzoate polyprenyltransferase
MLRTLPWILRSSHPVPGLAVTLIVVVLGLAAGLDPARLVLLGLVMLANQLSVGLSNDWIDADRDSRAGRTDKPVALGRVTRRAAAGWAFGTAAASVVLSIGLGWAAFLVHLVALVSAWSYNAGLKRTIISVVPYIVTFGLLPLLATTSLNPPRGAAWWSLIAGALLGIAAHIANVLPDLGDDRATGVRGLPHRLGRVTSAVVIAVSTTAAAALIAVGLVVAGSAAVPVAIVLLVVSIGIATTIVVLILAGRQTRALFLLMIAAALIDVVLLALGGRALLA